MVMRASLGGLRDTFDHGLLRAWRLHPGAGVTVYAAAPAKRTHLGCMMAQPGGSTTRGKIVMYFEKQAFTLSPDMADVARTASAAHGVVADLSEYDQLLGFLVLHTTLTPEQAVQAYFDGGAADAAQVRRLLAELGLEGGGRRVLEFASGYGRLTRHLKALLPDNALTASDIHPRACELLRNVVGVDAVISATDPDDLEIEGDQDFIFVLSLFSHLPRVPFERWLVRLYNLLSPGGVLMFTTHGEFTIRKNVEHYTLNFDPAIGFGYRTESDQQDLSSDDYGTTVVTMPFVYSTAARFIPDAEILSFRAGAWFQLQDEWLLRKPPAAPA
jgi:SAM-dependent methyltransferase